MLEIIDNVITIITCVINGVEKPSAAAEIIELAPNKPLEKISSIKSMKK